MCITLTFKGNKSYRSPTGSWFIQTFCRNLWKRAEVKHLDEIIRITQFQIANMLDIDKERKVIAQVMDRRNDSLTKIVWLCPKGILIHVSCVNFTSFAAYCISYLLTSKSHKGF